MIKNVTVDPYMFLISDEDEIRENLDFFNDLIRIVQKGSVLLYLFDGWKSQLMKQPLQPFPILLDNIHDKKLKTQILLLNESFMHALSNNFISIDIDSCQGNQDIIEPKDWLEDSKYYELFNVLLSACYKQIEFDSTIIVGNKKEKLKYGDSFSLVCECENERFEKNFRFGYPKEFEDEQDVSFDKLKDLVHGNSSLFVETPELKRAPHHNPYQRGNKNYFCSIDRPNRTVLNLLRHFGLYKIILKEYHNDISESAGTIVIKEKEAGQDSDILHGWLYCKVGLKTSVDLYFPVDIGMQLCNCLGEKFEYKQVSILKDRLCL